MPQRHRILVVDGSKYFDDSLWRMLIPEPEFEIAGLARNTDEAVKMVTSMSPDIVLVDLAHSEMQGLRAIESLHASRPGLPIIALMPISSREYTQAAHEAGANACVTKAEMADVLLKTIWRLISNRSSMPEP